MNPHEQPSPHHGLAVPVDPARAEALRARLHEQLIGRAVPTPTPRSHAAERQELSVQTHQPEPRARRIITFAAVVIAVVGLAGVAVIASRDGTPSGDQQPMAGAPPATTAPTDSTVGSTSAPVTSPATTYETPPTTPAATTVPSRPPLPDDQIAAAALPRRDGDQLPEYGEGWTSLREVHVVEMRGDIAAVVPECAAFLDAFESEDRPAVIGVELAWLPTPPGALSSTYVVVFPDVAAAEAMFDATRTPQFVRTCSPAYDQELYGATGQSLSQPGFSYFPYYNDRPLPSITDGQTYTDLGPIDLDVDEQWAIQLNYSIDTMQVTTLRIGRVIAVVQSSRSSRILAVDDTGRAVATPSTIQSEEDYHAILRGVVQRTRDALAGIAPDQAG